MIAFINMVAASHKVPVLYNRFLSFGTRSLCKAHFIHKLYTNVREELIESWFHGPARTQLFK